MDVRLVVEQGRRRLRVVRLRGPATRIGRARGSGVRIPSADRTQMLKSPRLH